MHFVFSFPAQVYLKCTHVKQLVKKAYLLAYVENFVKEEVFEELERITDISLEPKGLAQVCLLLARWSAEERPEGEELG